MEPDPTTEYCNKCEAEAMRKVLSYCAELGDVGDVEWIGTLASVPLRDTSGVECVKSQVDRRNWAGASACYYGNFSEDLVQWLAVLRGEQDHCLVEVIFVHELFMNDVVRLIAPLTTEDVRALKPFVHNWIHVPPVL